MDVDLNACFYLIRQCLPGMMNRGVGSIINVTSVAGYLGSGREGPYAASKAALNALVTVYAAEVRRAGITVRLISPPPTRTALRARAFPGDDPATLATPEDVARAIVKEIVAPRDSNRLLCYIAP